MYSSDKGKEMWFICKDAAPLSESGIFFRTLKQAQYFQTKGYSVKIICSNWVHNTNICHGNEKIWTSEVHDGIEYIFLKSLYYGNSGIKRFLSYVKFAADISKLLKDLPKPDVIVHTSRIPFDYQIYTFARKCKAKYIMDVSDLWPAEFNKNGYLRKESIILKLLYQVEKNLYSKADHVVFSFEGGKDYIIDHKWDKQNNGGPIDLAKVHYVNTGVDLKEFYSRKDLNKVEDKDINATDTFKVVYLGTMRESNDIGQIIDAAQCLKGNDNIVFLLYGDGPEREKLEERVAKEGITNVKFKDKWVTPEYVPYILTHSSVNLLNYMKGGAQYGGSMNKMFMAIASGKPIICNVGMGYSPIRKFNIGIDRSFDTPTEYADAIMSFYNMGQEEYDNLCSNCRKAAEDFDCNKLIAHMEEACEL